MKQAKKGFVYILTNKSFREDWGHIDSIQAKRTKKKSSLDGTTLTEDIEFFSPSLAASFVRGGASNGKYYWRSKDNKPLNNFIVYDN